MTRVDVTDYEVARDLLPNVCASCGRPTTERFVHIIRDVDGIRGVFQVLGLVFGLFFFPPLFAYTIRFARPTPVPVPTCPDDRKREERRRRMELFVLLPVWTVFAVAADIFIVVDLATNVLGVGCAATWLVVIGALLAAMVIGRGRVQVVRPGKTDVRLGGVHPAFVAALVEDRARDRVDNPDRRGGHGDQRDDFDEEPV